MCSFTGPHGGVLLSIANSQIERHIGPFVHGGRFELVPEFNLEDGQLEHLLRGLLAVAQDGSCADASVGELLVNAVCIRLAKRFAISKVNIVPCRGGLPPARLKRVLEYIESNLDKNITLTELAGVAKVSLYYFAVLFRQSTGLSPHRYVLSQRVERAKELLQDPKRSVLDVSMNVGFEHQNNFARAFRRVIGVSPTQFRRGCEDHVSRIGVTCPLSKISMPRESSNCRVPTIGSARTAWYDPARSIAGWQARGSKYREPKHRPALQTRLLLA
jgi:AraC family transcriptional regulator